MTMACPKLFGPRKVGTMDDMTKDDVMPDVGVMPCPYCGCNLSWTRKSNTEYEPFTFGRCDKGHTFAGPMGTWGED